MDVFSRGSVFVWWDFPHYAIGCGLGWLGLHGLQKALTPSQPEPEELSEN
jgi:hypothetical protein